MVAVRRHPDLELVVRMKTKNAEERRPLRPRGAAFIEAKVYPDRCDGRIDLVLPLPPDTDTVFVLFAGFIGSVF